MRGRINVVLLSLFLLVAVSSSVFGEEVQFRLQDSKAKQVFLAGNFNDWNATSDPMNLVEPGLWELSMDLAEGTYQYKFVVDGLWLADPQAIESIDDGFGGKNSVVVVGTLTSEPATSVSLKLGGYVKMEIAQSFQKDKATDKLPNPSLAGETWLKFSGKAIENKLDLFTEVGIKRNALTLNKDVRFQNFVPDQAFLNQARVTYLGNYADLSYYYKGRSGNSKDFLGLWFDEDESDKDKIGWERSGLGVATRWQGVDGRLIGLKRPGDQLIFGEAIWNPDPDQGIGAGLVYNSKPNASFASGYEQQLNATLWAWYQVTDQIKLDGQFLMSHGGRVVYEDMSKVPYTLIMTEDGAGDGKIGQSGSYGDIAYAQLRGAFNGWAWETSDGGWDAYQEGYDYNMVKQPDGSWSIGLELPPGDYEFKIRLFNSSKVALGEVLGNHGGNAQFVVSSATKPVESKATGFAYLLRGIYEEGPYGSTLTLKAAHPDVKNEIGDIGQNYFDVTTDSWYQALPETKLTFFTKNSYSYDLKTKYEILLKPGVEYVPSLEYVESLNAWYEYYIYATDKSHTLGLQAKATYDGVKLESTLKVNVDKQWELKTKVEGTISTMETDVEAELYFKNNFWSLKGETEKEILADVKFKIKGEYSKNKVIEAGGELSWFFPNQISDDLRLYLDYNHKSEIKNDVRTATEHKIAVGVKGDF